MPNSRNIDTDLQSDLLPGSIIVFDLDGTLVDSAWDLVSTLNKVIASEGLPAIPRDCVGHLVGQGALRMLDKAYQYYDRPLEDEVRARLHKQFLAIYDDHLADETKPFDGVIDVLEKLKNDGWILAVCTNKYEGMSRKLLSLLELDHYFSAICGSDTFPVRKPDPIHLFGTIEQAGAHRNRAIMIGDSETDIKTAHAADILSIGVTFGYSDRPIKNLSPSLVVEHFNKMLNAINQLSRQFEQTEKVNR